MTFQIHPNSTQYKLIDVIFSNAKKNKKFKFKFHQTNQKKNIIPCLIKKNSIFFIFNNQTVKKTELTYYMMDEYDE